MCKLCTTLLWICMISGCAYFEKPQITHQSDNLVGMHTSRTLEGNSEIGLLNILRRFYEHYSDVFDWIVIVSNVPLERQDMDRVGYWGIMYVLRNSTVGIGINVWDSGLFGTGCRLKGILHLPANSLIMRGPTLHEIMHLWMNDIEVIPTVNEGHWGFSDVYGQLGGFKRSELKELGNNHYVAGDFGTNANYGNTVPYSALELYLAGWISASEVPDILVFEDGRWIYEEDAEEKVIKEDDDGNRIFSGTVISNWSVERIIERLGERKPTTEQAQKEFKVATILIGNDKYPLTESDIKLVSRHVEMFSKTESIRSLEEFDQVYNFWEATGGMAKLDARIHPHALQN